MYERSYEYDAYVLLYRLLNDAIEEDQGFLMHHSTLHKILVEQRTEQ